MIRTKFIEAGLWGLFGNPIMIAPPLIITKDEIDEFVTKADKAIGEIGTEISIG